MKQKMMYDVVKCLNKYRGQQSVSELIRNILAFKYYKTSYKDWCKENKHKRQKYPIITYIVNGQNIHSEFIVNEEGEILFDTSPIEQELDLKEEGNLSKDIEMDIVEVIYPREFYIYYRSHLRGDWTFTKEIAKELCPDYWPFKEPNDLVLE